MVLSSVSDPGESSSNSRMSGGHSKVSKWISFIYSLGALYGTGFSVWVSLCLEPSVMSLSPADCCIGGEFPVITMSPCLCLFSVFVVQKLFSQSVLLEDCSTRRCSFGVSVGGGEARVFLCHHLLPSCIFYYLQGL